MNSISVFALILAGGEGKRLWPLSTSNLPKQFLKLGGSESMINQTVRRAALLCSYDRIYTVSHKNHEREIVNQYQSFGEQSKALIENIYLEPFARNTLPAIAWATWQIAGKFPDAIISVLPADHSVNDDEKFIESWRRAVELARSEVIALLGIPPNRPATDYGYIKVNDINSPVPSVQAFVEKPDNKTAIAYLADGRYFWNAGIFVFRASHFLVEIKKYCPDVFALCEQLADSGKLANADLYGQMPSLSIDYGLLERCNSLACVPATFEWSDLGSWQAVYTNSHKDENNNSICGNVSAADAKSCLIWTEGKMKVTVLGVENLAIVQNGDNILICPINRSAELKQLV